MRNAGKGPIEPLVASPFAEWHVGVSPDGRWISFVSDQSGRDEVYVRDLAGEHDQVLVSLEGGTEPVWGHDGRELFYREIRQGDPYLVAAGIRTSPTLAVTGRKRLFPVGDIVGTNPHANYDVSPTGRLRHGAPQPGRPHRRPPEPPRNRAAPAGRAERPLVPPVCHPERSEGDHARYGPLPPHFARGQGDTRLAIVSTTRLASRSTPWIMVEDNA